MFKKLTVVALCCVLSVALFAGCGGSKEEGSEGKDGAKGYEPKELTVQFVPSQSADTLEAKAKPLEELLKDKLGIPVKVSVSTDYNTVIEAMASKKIDVGFLPPTAYVIAHKKEAADVILQAQRYGIKDDNTGENTDELVDFYHSIILVKKDSGIKDVKDLKGKKVAWQNVTSSAGYVWPAMELQKVGLDPQNDVEGVTMKGHDQAVLALLNGQVDAAAVFEDARNNIKKDYPNAFKDTVVLKKTAKIPNDTISVRPDLTDEWKKKISDAFIEIGKDEKGKEIIRDVYSHEGYSPSKDSNFDTVREYEEELGE
ncbi:phosphate/phosphite/phosphonate ABC transporter substrate-binding protein [Numidum massiliense]|uniref:phosphate/phosphite/phosphonate ABC transporter substrate-binding protein n=1 Tax=Numidum massiliense TaxID=1522315 RepID=UPI0006D5395A|nr:phosphate/phosphite/phosphonate ABC transporter substrate-binding protein [Numidum massiliense]